MKRVPLWLTVVPLIVAVLGYWFFWNGYKNRFRTEIAAVFPGAPVEIGGFPYRLEAKVGSPRLQSTGDVSASANAQQAVLNRGPWQRDLTIVRSAQPRIVARIPALASSGLSISAPSAETSLHLDKDRAIARLSTVFDDPTVTLALLGVPVTAGKLEVHFRETPGRSAEAWSPSLPQRAQIVLAGEGVRTVGEPLKLAADIRVTGPTRLIDYARWAGKGSVEIHALTLGDSTGEVLRLDGTLVASGGIPRLTGTIVTSCPQSVRVALTGAPRLHEERLRLPVTLSLSGSPGAWQLGNLPTGTRATRAQQPACPVLR